MLSIKDRLNRMKFCRRHLKWTIDDWKKVIFSDESNFEVLKRKSKVLCRRKQNEKFLPRHIVPRLQGGGGSIGIWGCFSFKGTGNCKTYTGRVDQFKYQDILQECLIPTKQLFYGRRTDWFFQQDNAPPHRAATTRAFLQRNRIRVIEWPPRSPDLNPIEILWSIIDRRLAKKSMQNLNQLRIEVEKEFSSIPLEICNNLIKGMQQRLWKCLKARGGHFDG